MHIGYFYDYYIGPINIEGGDILPKNIQSINDLLNEAAKYSQSRARARQRKITLEGNKTLNVNCPITLAPQSPLPDTSTLEAIAFNAAKQVRISQANDYKRPIGRKTNRPIPAYSPDRLVINGNTGITVRNEQVGLCHMSLLEKKAYEAGLKVPVAISESSFGADNALQSHSKRHQHDNITSSVTDAGDKEPTLAEVFYSIHLVRKVEERHALVLARLKEQGRDTKPASKSA